MRYFLKDFKKTYNKNNPFGSFPEWKYYPKTGTHVGTDFVVAQGTPLFAPTRGEMLKVEFNKYKGNVGVFIFEHQGITWGLELCHLKELPKLGKYEEGDVVAYSGNTGAATTGAHLHTVLHRDAAVTKHYKELQSRNDFLRLQKDGAIVDCWEWFPANISEDNKHTAPEPEITPLFTRDLSLNCSGHDVFLLQKFLNTDTETQIAKTGNGAPGYETENFGGLTEKALKKFQVKYGLAADGDLGFGIMGTKTRAKFQELFGSSSLV